MGTVQLWKIEVREGLHFLFYEQDAVPHLHSCSFEILMVYSRCSVCPPHILEDRVGTDLGQEVEAYCISLWTSCRWGAHQLMTQLLFPSSASSCPDMFPRDVEGQMGHCTMSTQWAWLRANIFISPELISASGTSRYHTSWFNSFHNPFFGDQAQNHTKTK